MEYCSFLNCISCRSRKGLTNVSGREGVMFIQRSDVAGIICTWETWTWLCYGDVGNHLLVLLQPSLPHLSCLRGLGTEKHKPVMHEHPVTFALDPGSVGEWPLPVFFPHGQGFPELWCWKKRRVSPGCSSWIYSIWGWDHICFGNLKTNTVAFVHVIIALFETVCI